MKVSDAPFDRFEPYMVEGLDVLVGPEALIVKGLERGAVGAVSGLATAFPAVVARLVTTRDSALGDRVASLRAEIQRLPVPGALKAALGLQGVSVREDVRAPLRPVTDEERERVRALLDAAPA
jgi:dihydrodipicolinate synthase/N-acetylneuraminate lyase